MVKIVHIVLQILRYHYRGGHWAHLSSQAGSREFMILKGIFVTVCVRGCLG